MSRTAKMGLLIVIVVVLAGIYFIKNSQEQEPQIRDVSIAVTYEEAIQNDLPTMLEFRTET